MPPSAKLIVDQGSGFEESLGETPRGWVGQRNYLVNSEDAEEVMMCPELPQRGDKWSAKLPMVRVVARGPCVRLGGKRSTNETVSGWARVPIYYEETGYGVLKVPEPGNAHDAWTSWVPAVGTQRIYEGLERFYESTTPIDGPIDNGQGADIYVGQFEARVSAFYPLSEVLPIRDWVRKSQVATLNEYPMDLPRIFGTERRLSFAKGEILYLGPGTIETVNDWLRVEHVLKVAQSWEKVWQVEDAQGRRTETLVRDRLYEYADLRSLWQTR